MNKLYSKLSILLDRSAESTPGLLQLNYERRRDFLKVKAYLYRVVGGIPLNPNDSEKSSATKESFHQIAEPRAALPIPGAEALRSLWSDLKSKHPDARILVVYGERGSGKTAAVNWLIDKNYFTELKNEGITWFRSDILKIYKHSPAANLLTYTVAHSIYVALMHSKEDGAFYGVDRSQDSPASFFSHLADAAPADNYVLTLWRDLLSLWRSVDRSAEQKGAANFKSNEEPRKNFLLAACQILENAKTERQSKFLILANEFYRFVMRQAPGGVWLVVDGIDNIDRVDGDAIYEDLLKQLRQLPIETATWFTKLVLIMRGVTYEDFTRANAVEFSTKPIRHLVEPEQPEELFNSKPKIAIDPKSPYFRQDFEGAMAELGNSKRYLDSLQYFYPLFCQQLSELTRKFPIYSLNGVVGIKTRIEGRDAAPWQLMFNRSFRSYSRNVVSSYIFLLRILKSQNQLDFRGEDSDEKWTEWFIDCVKLRRRLISEGSFLAGEDFVCREHDRGTNPPGRWAPNIFWHQHADEAPYWGGLISIRVLQLLSSKKDGRATTETKIVTELSSIFGYWGEHVASSVRLLREFGLISADVRARASNAQSAEPGYRIRRKGLFIANLALIDPSVLYFLAEATPVAESVSQRYFRHSVGAGSRNFHLATLRTGVSFLRLLKSTYLKEQVCARAFLVGSPEESKVELFRLYHIESNFADWCRMLSSRILALGRSAESRSRKQAIEMVHWIDAELGKTHSHSQD